MKCMKLIYFVILSSFILLTSCGTEQPLSSSQDTQKNISQLQELNDKLDTQSSEEPTESQPTQSLLEHNIEVHYLDVGQGDAILIDYLDYEILIDAGNNWDGDFVSEYLADKVDGNLEIMVATHPHADHIGGLDVILEDYNVEIIIDSGIAHTTKTYDDYMSAVENENGATFIEDADMVFEIDENISFEIIELVDDVSDINSNSVVCKLNVFEISFLFTGDLTSEIELKYLEKFNEVDVLKIAHHGSDTSTSEKFIDQTNPRYAVISCGEENQYGHPNPQVLKRLDDKGIDTYRTDKQGTIIASVNGQEIVFNTPLINFKEDTPPAQEETINSGIFITETGSKFHVAGCQYLKSSAIEVTIDTVEHTHTACSRCM